MNTPDVLPAVQSFLARPAKMLIGGQWREAASGESIDALDPATGKTIGTFPAGGAADADDAVRAARRAFIGPWRKITPYERGRLLQKAAGLIEKHARGTRAAHHARKRQAAVGGEEGSRHRGELDRVLRRLDDEAARRDDPASRCRGSFSTTPCASRSASSPASRRRTTR